MNFRRVFVLLLAVVPGFAASGVAAAAEPFIPGVTDFPTRPAYVQQDEFIPGVTDFPTRRAYVEPGWTAPRSVGDTFVAVSGGREWSDAGIAAAAASAAALAAAAAAIVVARRTRRFGHGR